MKREDVVTAALTMSLDPDDPAPLYHQLKEQLRLLAAGLPAGAPMPSEADLVAATGVSRATIRRAVTDLSRDGVLRSRRGLGTFVAHRKVDDPLVVIQSFTDIVRGLGRVPSTKVLALARIGASLEVAEMLGIAPGDEVQALERLRLVDDVPCMVEVQYLSARLVPGLTQEEAEGSIYAVLEGKFGLRLVDGVETIQAARAPREVEGHLAISRGSPILLTSRITVADDQPVEFVTRYIRSDMWSFTFRLRRSRADEVPPVPVPTVPSARATISEPIPGQQADDAIASVRPVDRTTA